MVVDDRVEAKKITVLDPMGYPPKVQQKSMAPRLRNLDGRTIYLVDPHFDDSGLFLEQLQGVFAERLPNVKTKLVQLNRVYRHDDPKTWEEIQANGDGAILGVGHCSSCAPAVAVHAITLESKYNIPTVAIHTNIFERLIKLVTRTQGMLEARYAFVPQPVMGKKPEQLRAYITGTDPVTGRPVFDEIIEGLTKEIEGPLDDSVPAAIGFQRKETPRLLEPDTEDNLHALFLENNWTDKLPIVLPTEERVAEMLKHTSHAPDEVVGHMRPTGHRELWEYTVEKVAVNAVMAGAKPEYFPVILAIAASSVTARASTSSSAACMVVVNGPVRHEIGMNWGTGALGPFNHANATIGRAYGLLSQNLQGGAQPGLTYMGSMGNSYAYNNVTFAENEEDSPWEPLHVQKGFGADESTVSIFSGMRSTQFILGVREKHWREQVRNMLRSDPRSAPTFLLDPIAARQFVDRAGFETKEQLIRWVHENATLPADEYWDYQLIQNYVYPDAASGHEPYATMLKAAPDEMVRLFQEKEINVVVVGGGTNGYWRIMGAGYSKTVSVDDWR